MGERALARGDRPDLRGAVRSIVATALRGLGDEEGAARQRELALQELGPDAVHVRVMRSSDDLRRDRWAEARPHVEWLLARARSLGHSNNEVILLNNLGYCHLMLGALDRASELFDEAEPIALRIGDRRRLAEVVGNRGLLAVLRDDDAAAYDCFSRALREATEGGLPNHALQSRIHLAALAQARGDLATAHRGILEVAAEADRIESHAVRAYAEVVRFGIEADLGLARGEDRPRLDPSHPPSLHELLERCAALADPSARVSRPPRWPMERLVERASARRLATGPTSR